MELRFQAGGPESWSADAVIVFLSEDEKLEKAYPELLDAAPWMSIAPGMRDFHGKKGEMGLLYGPPAHPLSRAVVVGLGKLDALTYAETLEEIRKGAGAAAVRCRELGVDTLALPVSGLARFNADVERTIEEIVCAAMLGLWRNKAFKSKEPEDADPRWLALLFCDANVPDFPRLAARRGETHAEAVILARNLANTPANSLTPEDMAEEARKLARRHDMNCEVLEREDIVSLGMGAFAAVAAGSANDPRLIILEHAPAGHADEAPLIVVGKGITFDSGGISIKPAAGMWEMKGDMGGAAAVMGLFEALGQLETPRRVIGLMACAENMPDARATRPGDVVKTLSGKTVEIVNTDAEGRLVLCDALTYAQRRWNPSMIVDVATSRARASWPSATTWRACSARTPPLPSASRTSATSWANPTGPCPSGTAILNCSRAKPPTSPTPGRGRAGRAAPPCSSSSSSRSTEAGRISTSPGPDSSPAKSPTVPRAAPVSPSAR